MAVMWQNGMERDCGTSDATADRVYRELLALGADPPLPGRQIEI